MDGLRALAFFVVFLSHAPGMRWVPGGFGVTIFFFLSGFLLTTLMRREAARTGRVSVTKFYLRRAVRIFPAMYLTLAFGVGLAAAGLLPNTPTPRGVAAEALHLTNYFVIAGNYAEVVPGQHVYWSLAVEEHFYLIFPLLIGWAMIHRSRRWNVGALILGCAVILAWRLVLVFALDADPLRVQYGSDTRVDSILFGVLLAMAANPVLDPPIAVALKRPLLILGMACIGLVATILIRDVGFRETWRYSLQGLLLMPVYYIIIARETSPIIAVLSHPWLRYLGVISYSLYLIHDTLILVLERALSGAPAAAVAVVALAASISYASCMWLAVEAPLVALRRRLRT